MIKPGDKAPRFSLPSDDGTVVTLSDFKGKKVILYFYPKDLTPGCTQEACDFRDASSVVKKKKAVVLGISKDPVKLHLKFKEKYTLNFPLLSDEGGQVCKAYGVWQNKKFMGRSYMGIVRTTFVISEKGTVEKVFESVKVKGHAGVVVAGL